jgi:molecular chaperone GrpE (heat shock protein)/outer membrane murein-binding lipoprotein Lpp
MSTEENDSNSDLSTSLDNGTEIGDNNQEQIEKVATIDETAQNSDALTAKNETVSQENNLPEEVTKISSDSAGSNDIIVNPQTDDLTNSGDASISQENRLNTFADEDNPKESEDITAKDSVQMESNTNFLTQTKSTQRDIPNGLIRGINTNFNHVSTNISDLFAKHEQLLEKYNKQSKELDSVKEKLNLVEKRLDKLEEMSKSEFDELIQETLKQDAQILSEDEQECQGYIDQAKLWQSKTETLSTSVLFAICRCGDRMKQCDELMEKFKTETPSLYKSLQSRYESLQLSNRMLDRLREPLELLSKSSLPPEHLFRLRMSDLVELLRSQTDESQAKQILAKKLKEAGDARYKSIREWRESAEKLQKQWLHFIEKKLLPALDGINDGKPYAEPLVIDLKESYQTSNHQDQLTNWLKTYSDLEDILLEALNSLEITMMQAEAGQPVDYDRHEPIGTEPDDTKEHEHIKEVTRKGYEYKIEERSLLLRNAQVVVVKNK